MRELADLESACKDIDLNWQRSDLRCWQMLKLEVKGSDRKGGEAGKPLQKINPDLTT